ncbi:CARDB domain-containing protein [Halorubrum sp. BV1]|uniref:CARDB domain-containing protein n=1 Tax=Halorubrum sp. BV1 TaxID=1498500 RepID=UPI00067860B9|nr:CARDB domain-containing protein [Halorubrum sp. BV1]
MHGQRIAAVLVAVLMVTSMVAVPGAVTAQDEDEPDAAEPASYYGTVDVDGAPAPPGTVIEAVAHAPGADPTAGDGDVRDSVTVGEDALGEFGGPDLFDEKLVVDRTTDDPDDLRVSFLVDGQLARTIEWRAGDVRELDLAATDEPTPVFDVSIDDISPDTGDAIVAGQSFTVTATVENIGTASGEETVDLLVGGEETDETTVDLDPTENETVEFTVETDDGDAPGTEVTVATADRSASQTVVIERPDPPAFDLTEFEITDGESQIDEAAQGDEVTLNATVENVGERNGSVTVDFALGDEDVTVVDESAEVSVDASADEGTSSGTVSVTATIEDAPRAGVHTLDASASIPEDAAGSESTATREATLDVDYESIQSGVDAAVDGDDTVAVASPDGDAFTENVDVTEGVTVEAATDGISVEPAPDADSVFTLQSDATVSGLTVSESGSDDPDTAIAVAGDGAAVEGVTVDGFTTGVDVGGSNAAVRRSAFAGQTTSVDVGSDATGAAVEYNEFTVDGADTVVDIDAAGVQVTGNALEPDSGTAEVGIALNEGARANVRENTILTRTDDADADTAGIELNTSADFGASLAVRNNFNGSGTEFTGDNGVDIRVVGNQSNVGGKTFDATRNWAGGDPPTAAAAGNTQQVQAPIFASGAAQIAPLQIETQAVSSVDTSNQLDDPVEPANVSVGIDSPAADFEAVAGETLTVDATVANNGEASGQQTIALEDGTGATLDETTLELDGGTSDAVSLSYTPESATSDLALNVSSEDDDAQVTGSVIAPAEFGVSGLDAPDRVQSGNTVDVSATVENVGDASGSDEIELRFGDDVTGTEGDDYAVLDTSGTGTLDGGASAPVEFTGVQLAEDGVSEIGVASGDTVVRQAIVVEPAAAFFDVSLDAGESDTTVTAGETATVTAVVENVGGQEAAQLVEVLVDGAEDADSTAVRELADGGTAAIPVSVDTGANATGTIEVVVSTDDDEVTQSVTIEQPPETGDGTDGDDDGTDDTGPVSSGGGGGGGGIGFGADPVDSLELDAVETETETPSADFEANQRVATFGSVQNVESIAFDATDQVGEVAVSDVDPASADVNPPGAAVTVQEISVPDDATDRSATIEFDVSADRLDAIGAEPSELTAVRLNEGEWETLDTTVTAETADGVTLEAETPGFSVFAVNAVSEPEAAATVDPGTVTVGEEVTLDGSESTDEYGEIVAYDWSVAGESLSGETATATIDETGEYTIELTVTNDAGETDTATADLAVDPGTDAGDGTDGGTDEGEPTEEPAGLGLPAIGGVIALVIVAAAAVAVRRRRRSNDKNPFR